MSDQQAKKVSLVESLESVPLDARLFIDDGPYSTSYWPIGKMSHEAAVELRRLNDEVQTWRDKCTQLESATTRSIEW